MLAGFAFSAYFIRVLGVLGRRTCSSSYEICSGLWLVVGSLERCQARVALVMLQIGLR
jgi:hypothetical protein